MPRIRAPLHYKAPIKRRSDIVEWLVTNTCSRYYDYRQYPVCFNVKCYTEELGFERLLERWLQSGYANGEEADPLWLAEARRLYIEKQHILFSWGIEGASRGFLDGDTYRYLYDGTQLDVEYAFVGASGGWLTIIRFEGYDLVELARSGGYSAMTCGMDYGSLRKLYRLAVMLKHDLQQSRIAENVEHHAAFDFFANICEPSININDIRPQTIVYSQKRRSLLRS